MSEQLNNCVQQDIGEMKVLLKQLNDKMWYLIIVLVGVVAGQRLLP